MTAALHTIVRQISATQPEQTFIDEAASFIRAGRLVAFPTETVYGLGANALDADAVSKIFAAKGRPASNPVIVHVADAAAARRLTTEWPEHAKRLAAAFWPGPLTLVLPKAKEIPGIVVAGGTTVGVRVPQHPVALSLVQAAGVPIAAPSANLSEAISPTTAQHVLKGLDGRIDMLLDAGPTIGGLESTVIDLTTDKPRLLRPGLVTVEMLEAILGPVDGTSVPESDDHSPRRSPGQLPRHYAPRARLLCLPAEESAEKVMELGAENRTVGWLPLEIVELPELPTVIATSRLRLFAMPREPAKYAAQLYATLHACDDAGVDFIVAELPPDTDAWRAIHDRLQRAAST